MHSRSDARHIGRCASGRMFARPRGSAYAEAHGLIPEAGGDPAAACLYVAVVPNMTRIGMGEVSMSEIGWGRTVWFSDAAYKSSPR